jgi:putative transposase
MSWKVAKAEHVRMEFVLLAREREVNMSELCRQFGVSRKTGYKWKKRYEREGLQGLRERSRAPKESAVKTSVEQALRVVRLRGEHPSWGPKKLRAVLLRELPSGGAVASVATIGRIIKQAGLSEAKGRGRPRRWRPLPLKPAEPQANKVWSVDFKGWWRVGDGSRCEPLSVRDLWSRYILCLRPMSKRTGQRVRGVFEELFERYGLPERIRSDNGAPFASMQGLRGLTALSAWWYALGIELERIEPGQPQQNGAHERMHLDVAREVEGCPAPTLVQESKRLEHWRLEYNLERPHEALGMRTPAELYQPSPRPFQPTRAWPYPCWYARRRVRRDGSIRLRGKLIFISEALRGQELGMEPLDEERWALWFCQLRLGEIDFGQGASFRPTASTQPLAAPEVLPMS